MKENVEALKQELSTEEQFLESVIKAEGFFRKYKKILITLAALLVAGVLIYLTLDYLKNRDLTQSNQALAALQKNPSDKGALERLRAKNPSLYALFQFHQVIEAGDAKKIAELSKTAHEAVLRDLAAYQSGALEENEKALSAYSRKQEALLRELALLDDAFLLFQEGRYDDAKARLAQIPLTSRLSGIVQSFSHYMK